MDLCRVLLIGNLATDLRSCVGRDGITRGYGTVCVARTVLQHGEPVDMVLAVPIEVVGAARVSALAQQFRAGSRVLIEGHLEERQETHIEELDSVSGSYHVTAFVPRSRTVVVIDTIFSAESPEFSATASHSVWTDA